MWSGMKKSDQVWSDIKKSEQVWSGMKRSEQVWAGMNRHEQAGSYMPPPPPVHAHHMSGPPHFRGPMPPPLRTTCPPVEAGRLHLRGRCLGPGLLQEAAGSLAVAVAVAVAVADLRSEAVGARWAVTGGPLAACVYVS